MKLVSFFRYLFVGAVVGGLVGETPLVAFPAGKDAFAQATPITTSGVWTNSFTDFAPPTDITAFTAESGEPYGNAAGNTAWWRWTPSQSGWATFDTFTRSNAAPPVLPRAVLSVYTGTAVNALTRVTSNRDYQGRGQAQVSFFAEAGVTYHLQLDGETEAFLGSAVVNLRFFVPEAFRVLGNFSTEWGAAAFTVTGAATGGLSGRLTVAGTARVFKVPALTAGWLDVLLPGVASAEGQVMAPLRLTVDLIPDKTLRSHEAWLEGAGSTTVAGSGYRVRRYSSAAPHGVPSVGNVAMVSDDPGVVGHGYFRPRVSVAGTVTGAGRYGDGRSFTFASATCEAQATVRMPFGAGAAALSGGFQFSNFYSAAGVTVFHRKPSMGLFYPAGLRVPFTVSGEGFAPIDVGNLEGDALTLKVSGTPAYGSFNESLQLAPRGRFVFASTTRRPVLRVDPATGIVSGTILIGGSVHTLQGILVTPMNDVSIQGWVRGPAQTGGFVIEH